MAPRGHDLAGAVAHLGRVVGLLLDDGGEAEHGVHGSADVVGHVGEEGRFRLVGHLGRPKRLGELLGVQRAFLLPCPLGPGLLAPVEAVEDDAQAEGRDGDGGHHDQGDVHRLGLALDGLHGHIAHQIGGAISDGPQIAQGLGALHLMGEHDVLAVCDTVRHHGEDDRIGDVVGPVEVLQIHMPRITLAHALGLQHEALRGGVHEIEHGPLAVEALGQRLVDGIEGVLGVQLGDGDAVALDGTLHRVGPAALGVHVGLGDGQPPDGSPAAEIERRRVEGGAVVGDADVGPLGHDGDERGGIAFAQALHSGGRIARGGQLGGQKPLELRLAVLNGLHRAFHEVQVLVEVQNGGIGHVVGGLLRDGPDRGPHDCEDEHDDQGQAREALPIPDGVLGRLHSGGAPFPFEICLLNSTSSEGKLQGENGIRQGENEARPQRDAHKKAPPAGEPEELCSVRTEEKGITCAWKSFPPRGF